MSTFSTRIQGSSETPYEVKLKDGKYSCTCPHFLHRLAISGGRCKHITQAIENKLIPANPSESLEKEENKRIPRGIISKVLDIIIPPIKALADAFEVCGSWRRGLPDCKDIDIVICVDKPYPKEDIVPFGNIPDPIPPIQIVNQINHILVNIPGVTSAKGSGDVYRRYFISISDWPDPIHIEIAIMPWASWGSCLCHFTGSAQENLRLREIAIKKGYSLSQYGFRPMDNTSELITFKSEEEVYQFLGIPFVEPSKR